MARAPEPTREQARRACALARPWAGRFFRATTPGYARSDEITTAAGSARYGGRWNPPGLRTLYGSREIETAVREAGHRLEDHGIPLEDLEPLVLVVGEARARRILDLGSPQVLDLLDVAIDDLVRHDWREADDAGTEALTQRIGRLVHEYGVQGLLAPSARSAGGGVVALFPGSLDVHGADDLRVVGIESA